MTIFRSKPRLLIHWGNAYVLEQYLGPMMQRLAERFEITLILVNWRMSARVMFLVEGWCARGVISGFWMCPGHTGTEVLRWMWDQRASLALFDAFFGISAFHPAERFMVESGLRKDCRRVLFWPHPCNLWLHPWIVEELPLDGGTGLIGDAARSVLELGERWDALLLHSEEDVAAHQLLFGRDEVYAVRYGEAARCAPSIDALLVPFSLHAEQDMRNGILLEQYARDVRIAKAGAGVKGVHIRPHPGRPPRYASMLAQALQARGVDCVLVDCDNPIAFDALKYPGVFGPAGGALRDAALLCDGNFVVGSMALSVGSYADPKRVIGFGERIGWIEEDGSCAPGVFEKKDAPGRHLPDAADLVCELAS